METSIPELVFYYPKGHPEHFEGGHPERPERVEVMRQALEEIGWWNEYPQLDPVLLSETSLQAVHAPAYLRLLEEACRYGMRLDMDTYTTPSSWQLARNAAGGAVAVANTVWHGQAQRGFALTRPPGHHAGVDQGMGFCLLNNIAIAAEYLIQNEGANRLAVIDLDLHHGNGTQEIFWRRADVFYLSTHQSPFYPGTGALDEVGSGPGKGATANFPLPYGSGDQAFQEVMSKLILPLLERFNPQMLLVSFGFDPHWRDPLGSLLLSAQGYGNLISALAQFADEKCAGRIALILEGGYDLEAAAACAQAAAAALTHRPWHDPCGPSPQAESRYWISMVEEARELWNL